MRLLFWPPASLVAATLVLGCEHTSSTALEVQSSPAFAVERITVTNGFFFDLDGRRGVLLGHTFEDLLDICAGREFQSDVWDQLTVTRPNGSILQFTAGIVDAVVWDAVGDPCQDLLTEPHYSGTVRVRFTDNDLDLSGNGANATGFTVTGTLTSESGQEFRFLMVVRGTIAPGGTADDLQNHVVKTQLTPTGG